ncbi:MAG: alpha/beta fold hydrolase [Thermoplasmata archaeon]
MPADARSGSVPVPGGQLYFEQAGRGPALVLIHSAFLDRREWDPQFASYADRHTVVRYDVRGVGLSTGDRSSSSDGEDLAAVLNHLNLPAAFVLGNSDGARIACELAAGLPDRVRGLVLVAGNPHDLDPTPEEEARFLDTAEVEQQLLALMQAGKKPEAVEQILDLWAPQVPPAERDRLRGITSENYEHFVAFMTRSEPPGRRPTYPVAAFLRAGRMPILSISGAHDNPALNMMMGRFAAQVPSAHHVELEEGDHTASLSATAAFDRAVLDFLERVEGGRAWPPPKG